MYYIKQKPEKRSKEQISKIYEEYVMNKIFQICEIAATVLETAILLEFINKLLGSKLRGIRNILQLLCAFVLINGYMITSAHISVKYSAVLDLFGILLYVNGFLIINWSTQSLKIHHTNLILQVRLYFLS